jgi:hypothetical protein
MEQRDHEVAGLRSEIEKLKRRELGWATELQDAATVTSQLTERMEILESVLATKEEALSQAQVQLSQCNGDQSCLGPHQHFGAGRASISDSPQHQRLALLCAARPSIRDSLAADVGICSVPESQQALNLHSERAE